jgi:hypothetical protein
MSSGQVTWSTRCCCYCFAAVAVLLLQLSARFRSCTTLLSDCVSSYSCSSAGSLHLSEIVEGAVQHQLLGVDRVQSS